MSSHNFDVVAETSHAIAYMKSLDEHNLLRLNRRTDLTRHCWLHNFYDINQLYADNILKLSACGEKYINTTISLTNTYFHSMVNVMLSESALGTTNTLYTIGMYNPVSEQWKISRALANIVKFAVDGWNGTVSIVSGEVEQIRSGVENSYEKMEDCSSQTVQKYLNKKIEATTRMSKCL